ncbi:MAG: DUF983 domain-containing protein [Pseudomonadota bacterium]
MFETHLKLKDACSICGADFSDADSGDGPAFFVMFLIAIIVTPPVLLVQVMFDPPMWLQVGLWGTVSFALAWWLLRPFKSLLFALQWKNKAEEAKWEQQ